MKIRIQRKIEVFPAFQRRFLSAALESAEKFGQTTGVHPEVFVNLYKNSSNVEVRVFTDFESLAQYEDLFLHKVLRDAKYLDTAEGLYDMIVDEPQDEMYVRMDTEDFFLSTKHKVKIGKNIDLKRDAKLNKRLGTYRIEREYCA